MKFKFRRYTSLYYTTLNYWKQLHRLEVIALYPFLWGLTSFLTIRSCQTYRQSRLINHIPLTADLLILRLQSADRWVLISEFCQSALKPGIESIDIVSAITFIGQGSFSFLLLSRLNAFVFLLFSQKESRHSDIRNTVSRMLFRIQFCGSKPNGIMQTIVCRYEGCHNLVSNGWNNEDHKPGSDHPHCFCAGAQSEG